MNPFTPIRSKVVPPCESFEKGTIFFRSNKYRYSRVVCHFTYSVFMINRSRYGDKEIQQQVSDRGSGRDITIKEKISGQKVYISQWRWWIFLSFLGFVRRFGNEIILFKQIFFSLGMMASPKVCILKIVLT